MQLYPSELTRWADRECSQLPKNSITQGGVVNLDGFCVIRVALGGTSRHHAVGLAI